MPFVSGMEREEEAVEHSNDWSCFFFYVLHSIFIQEYHLQNALDAQRRLGSAKMRAVPIPDLYEDANSQSIYPANVELPKQLIHLQRIRIRAHETRFHILRMIFF